VTTTQIAINYVVAKGCVPVPTINNPREADELIACLGWDLTDEEVKMLDNAADMSDKGRIV
jgi:diketogulonate reductase-like aldo/keto reductase